MTEPYPCPCPAPCPCGEVVTKWSGHDMWTTLPHKNVGIQFRCPTCDPDLDYNLVYRWDWRLPDADDEEPCEVLKIYFMGQRKALCRSVEVAVTKADEESVRAYLLPRWEKLRELWAPLSGVTL